MGLVDELKEGKVSTIIIIILGILIFHLYFTINNKEPMADVGSLDQVKEAVKQVYMADVEAIRNLSNVATKLQAEGLTVPGNLKTNIITSTDNISVSNKTNEGGRLRILNELKNGKAGQTNDWSIWNMTGDYGNKLSFWRYNGDGKNAGPALDLMDDGNVNVPGNLKVGNTNITSDGLKVGNTSITGDGKLCLGGFCFTQDLLSDLKNTQTGITNFGSISGVATKAIKVTFPVPYKTGIPKVFISPYVLDVDKNRNLRYNMSVSNITLTDFVISFTTWADTYIYGVAIGWSASI